MKECRIGSLSNEIARELELYNEDIKDNIAKASDGASRKLVEALKRDSPKRTGEYANGWTRKKNDKGYVVYNAPRGQITALLEYGHQKVNHKGRVQAYPHIDTNEKLINEEFELLCRKIISEGGKS